MIYDKLRNYDVAKKRHHTDLGTMPTNVSELPAFHEPGQPIDGEDDRAYNTQYCSSNSSDDAAPPGDGAADVDQTPVATQRGSWSALQMPPVAVTCGAMPSGTGLHDFHAPPLKAHSRNAEAVYWREFGSQVVNAFGQRGDEDCEHAVTQSWGISSLSAVTAVEKQKLFFKAIDKYQSEAFEPTATSSTAHKGDSYDRAVAAAVQKLPATYTKSPTVVLKAAFYLLQEGLLNIPDIGVVNVKQARAFLWNAVWLQEHMNKVWEADHAFDVRTTQQKSASRFSTLHLAIVGPGGTGKTAVLKVTEALTTFFLLGQRLCRS